jgi:hypothetical protein
MKIRFLLPTLASLCFSLAATAGQFNATGIPAAARGVIHLDLDAAAKSPFAGEVQKSFFRNFPQIETLKTEFGFSSEKGISAVTIALIPTADTAPAAADSPPRHFRLNHQGVILVRGEFVASKIMAGAVKKNARPEIIEGRAFLDASSLAFAKNANKKIMIGSLDNNTLLLADADVIKDVIDAFSGKSKSYVPPESLAGVVKQADAPIVAGYLDKKLFSTPEKTGEKNSPADSVLFFLSDNGREVNARLSLEFPASSDVRNAKAEFQKILFFYFSDLSGEPSAADKTDPEKTALRKLRTKLHNAIKISSTERALDITAAFPTDDSLLLLTESAGKVARGE